MSVIVGYLPNPEGEAALEAAISESVLRRLPLVVLNTSRGEAHIDDHLASEEVVGKVKDRLAAEGVDHEFLQFARGKDAADEMLELIAERNPTLVVIGVRRRSPVGKLFLGSTAQRILLGADCHVLAVKA
jgi:nucleotide-binding universal stress UspA family protein